MTPSLEQVVAGIKTRLETVDSEVLAVFDHAAADPSEYPCVMILPPTVDYRQTMRAGIIKLEFRLIVLASSAAGYDEAQASLWPYLDWAGGQSIFGALEADHTLGLTGVDALVSGPSEPLGLEEIAATETFGASIPFTVHVTRSLTP